MSSLALLDGSPVRTEPLPGHETIGSDEKDALNRVVERGNLSGFLGSWGESFYGGPEVKALEEEWEEYFNVDHAVSVNSNTTGLLTAVGAAGIGPGDEVIVTPYTMSATSTAIIFYDGIPVFADIESETYGLDPDSVEERITDKTKAIIVTHLFGHPARMRKLKRIADRNNLTLIEDAAQAPGAVWNGEMVGGISDLTVFSLNVHKHIHSGEGGVVTTNNEKLADRVSLIRNHGESVVDDKGETELENSFGLNLRMTEMQAAVARAQLEKFPDLLEQRLSNVQYLDKHLGEISGIETCVERDDCKHVYYVHPYTYGKEEWGIERDTFVKAIQAELPPAEDTEGTPIRSGYITPSYLLPMYQEETAYSEQGYPFSRSNVSYEKGLCPTCERVESQTMLMTNFHRPYTKKYDLDDVIEAFEKVYENQDQLVKYENEQNST